MRALLLIATLLAADAASACTTFCTRGLFGRNYDFEIGYGMVLVNKRGMVKVATTPKPAKWTSRYGSVTFNQFGRDVPTGGMNEAGLVVELMWLDGTRYPKADARPEVGTLEWIQYQLDTAGSVAGVLANMKHVRIAERGVPLHYLVADKTGDVAAIEFLGGEVVVHRGESLRVPVLANDP
ncbi:MAG TPA: linear amide C-N hydrolase, partial [Thermoanaerobaculia bacterium]